MFYLLLLSTFKYLQPEKLKLNNFTHSGKIVENTSDFLNLIWNTYWYTVFPVRLMAINTHSQDENAEGRSEKVIMMKIMKISCSIWRIIGRIPKHLLIIVNGVPIVSVEKTALSRGVEGDFGARESDLDWCLCRGVGEAFTTAFKIDLSTSRIPFDATT